MTVRAIRWFGGGKCLVADEETNETFTVARLLPGEQATVVRYERQGRRVPVADRISDPSPHRQDPACNRYERCTGCDLLHVSEAAETGYKQLTVQEVLARHAGIHVDRVEVVGGAFRGNHRARARFTVERTDGRVRMGMRDFAGDLTDTTDCRANSHEVRATLRDVRRLLGDAADQRVSAVEVSAGLDGTAVVYEVPESAEPHTYQALLDATFALEEVAAAGIRRGSRQLEAMVGEWPRQLPIGDLTLGSAADAWVQPTPKQAAALYAWVLGLGLHRRRSVLDATCGTGGLSLAMAADATEVLAVDANWAAVRSATASAEALGAVNVRFRGGKIQTVAARLRAAGTRFDHTVINPMRRSLGDECMGDIAEITGASLLYLAPAPRAGAADVRALVDAGFAVERVASVNLHPGTSKVLMAVVLQR